METPTAPHETTASPDEGGLRALLEQRDYPAAFQGIVDQFGPKVFRLAYSMTHHRARAEDLAQDALLRVWKALPSYDGRASLSTWIYTIARNVTYTELRRTASRHAFSMDDPDRLIELEKDPALSTADRAAGLKSDLETLLRRLPQRQRQVVTLFYLEQKSLEQVGAALDMPIGTVKSLLHRAKAALAAASELG